VMRIAPPRESSFLLLWLATTFSDCDKFLTTMLKDQPAGLMTQAIRYETPISLSKDDASLWQENNPTSALP
jgi:hypothetical protein